MNFRTPCIVVAGDVGTLTIERKRVESLVGVVNAPRCSLQCSYAFL